MKDTNTPTIWTRLNPQTLWLASVILTAGILSGCNGTGNGNETESLDPTVVAPEEFTTVLENEQVRVVRVVVEDGTQPATHSHPDRVVIFLNSCTWLEEAEDGSIIAVTDSAGTVSWQEATLHESYPNSVKETCELLEVELK